MVSYAGTGVRTRRPITITPCGGCDDSCLDECDRNFPSILPPCSCHSSHESWARWPMITGCVWISCLAWAILTASDDDAPTPQECSKCVPVANSPRPAAGNRAQKHSGNWCHYCIVRNDTVVPYSRFVHGPSWSIVGSIGFWGSGSEICRYFQDSHQRGISKVRRHNPHSPCSAGNQFDVIVARCDGRLILARPETVRDALDSATMGSSLAFRKSNILPTPLGPR